MGAVLQQRKGNVAKQYYSQADRRQMLSPVEHCMHVYYPSGNGTHVTIAQSPEDRHKLAVH